MENIAVKTTRIAEELYREFHSSVFQYILYKIGNKEEAEDLSQDTFVRLMEYKQMLCEETAKCFIFTIARNIVTDYLRRHYKKQEVTVLLMEGMSTSTNEMESRILANDLAVHEELRMKLLPPQRRVIYQMSRFEDKTVEDMALEMQLSKRTVERHLLLGRKEIRTYMKKCI